MSHSDSEINKSRGKVGKKLHVNFKASLNKTPRGFSKRDMWKFKRQTKVLREMDLLRAATCNDTETLKRKLAAGVSPNCCDDHGRSGLHIAATKGYTDIVQLLLSHGADPNINDKLNNTPLHLAACTHNHGIISLLVKAGASVKKEDLYGKNPLQLAQSKLQLMQRNWREGSYVQVPVRSELKLIMDLLIAVSGKEPEEPMGTLEWLNSLDDKFFENLDDQVSRLLVELEGIKLSEDV